MAAHRRRGVAARAPPVISPKRVAKLRGFPATSRLSSRWHWGQRGDVASAFFCAPLQPLAARFRTLSDKK
jgi:hypothetical protein